MANYKELDADGKLRIPFEWQSIGSGGDLGPHKTYRVPVTDGWLVYCESIPRTGQIHSSVAFVPDPEHRWTAVAV